MFTFSECPLAEFVTSPSDHEKIPFVFLPLASGQAVYPSARIKIGGGVMNDPNLGNSQDHESRNEKSEEEPICVVSSTDLMYKDGWNNLEKIYNGLHSVPLRAPSSNVGKPESAQNNFYHHPLRLVQQPNAKTQLQVNILKSYRQ